MARPHLARVALSLGLLWLAAGALYKLFEGSPNDLPATVKDLSPLGPLATMRLAVGIELAVIGLVITLPRIGWFFLAGALAVFCAVLVPLVLEGAESCGCFGGNITIDPKVMLAVDGALLVFILATAPWRVLPRESGLGAAALLPFLAVAVLAPYGKLQDAQLPSIEPRRAPQHGEVTGGDATGTVGEVPGEVGGAPDPAGVAGVNDTDVAAAAQSAETSAPEPAATAEADPLAALALPEFYELRVQDWVGQDVWTTPLANFFEYGAAAGYAQGAFQPNCHVIVYRQTCEHCEEHLKQVWQEQQNGEPQWQGKTIVLLRLAETKDTAENNLCVMLPEPSEKITFPPLKRGYGITTPYTFDLDEAGLIQNPIDLRKDK